jgi:hypothetical protein
MKENKGMEVQLAKLEQKIDMHCEQNHEEFLNIKNEFVEVKTLIKEALGGKANKWVETATWFLISSIVISAIGFFVYLVQKGVI